MATKRNDVVLTVRANDLGTPVLEKLKTTLGQVAEAQRTLSTATGDAGKVIADLTEKRKQLGDSLKPLASLQATAQRLVGTGADIKAKKDQLADLTAQLTELKSELANVAKPSADQRSALSDLQKQTRSAQTDLNKLIKTASGLSDTLGSAGLSRSGGKALGQINLIGGDTKAAIAGVDQVLARQKEISAEVQRRAALEKQSSDAAIAAGRQLAQENAERRARLADAVETLGAKAELDYQREITAEVKRRTALEKQSSEAAITAARQLAQENAARRARLADAVEAFTPSTGLDTRRLQIASAQESQRLASQARAQADAVAAAKAKESSAARESASVFAQVTDQEIQLAARRAAALRAEGKATDEIIAKTKGVKANAAVYRELDASLNQVGASAGRAGRGFSLFRDEGRTTLSLAQRIRGEVLSLAAAYVGLYGAIDQINKVIDASRKQQSTLAILTQQLGGDTEAAAQQYAFLRSEADRTKQSFDVVTEGYTKVGIAAQKYGLTQEETNKLFSDIVTTTRALGLSADQNAGIFKAVSDSFNKTTIQAEELKGQIGDQGIAGAITTLAKVLPGANGDVSKLNTLIQNGQVPARAYLLLFNELAKESLPGFAKQTNSADAAINDFNNAVGDLRREFANSGFIQAFTESVRELSEKFKDPEFKAGVRELGALFGNLLKVFVEVASNGTTVRLVLEALTLFITAKAIGGIASLITSFKTLGGSAALASKAITSVTGALGVLGAAFTGFEIGTFLNKFAIVQRSADTLFGSLFDTLDVVKKLSSGDFKGALNVAKERRSRIIDNTFNPLTPLGGDAPAPKKPTGVSFFTGAPGENNALPSSALRPAEDTTQAEKIRADQRAAAEKKLQEALVKVTDDANQKRAESNKDYFEKYKAQYAEQRKIFVEFAKTYGDDSQLKAFDAQLRKIAGVDQAKDAAAEAKRATAAKKAEAAKQIALQNELNDQLGRLQVQQANEFGGTLKDALKGVELQYQDTYDKIDQITDESVKKRLRTQLDAIVALQEKQATQTFYAKQVDEAQTKLNDLIGVQSAQIDAVNAKVAAGLLTERQGREEIKRIQDAYRESILSTVDDLIRLLEALPKDVFAKLGGDKLIAQLKKVATETAHVQTEAEKVKGQLEDTFAGGTADALVTFGRGLAGVLTGANSLSDAFKGAADAFRNFAADFLIQIAQMILKQAILNELQSAGGGSGSFFGIVASAVAGSAHTGGPVSAPPGNRSAMSSWFAGAPRYHTGGIVGLAPNEVPIIAKRGEEVLSEGDPRNALNGKKADASGGPPQSVAISNFIDAGSFVSKGLATREGQRAIINFISANRNTFKSVLQG